MKWVEIVPIAGPPRVRRRSSRLSTATIARRKLTLFSGFIVAVRIVQPWIAVYAADTYIGVRGLSVNAAVVRGGLLAVVAYSLLGRGIGCPLAGRLSDIVCRRGIARTTVAIVWLLAAIALLGVLAVGVARQSSVMLQTYSTDDAGHTRLELVRIETVADTHEQED